MNREKIISMLLILNEEKEQQKLKIEEELKRYKGIYPYDFENMARGNTSLSYIAFELKKKLLVNNENYKKALGLIWFWESWMGDLYNLKERIEKLNKWGEQDDICDEELGWGYGEIYKWWSYNITPERLVIAYILSKEI